MDSSIVFDKIKKFFTGDLFIVAAAAVVFIGWVTGLWAAFLCVLALLCTAPLIFTSSNRSLLVFFMQFTFIISRDRGVFDRNAVEDEIVQAMTLFRLQKADPRIGFEASNHYFYSLNDLREKVISCSWILKELN